APAPAASPTPAPAAAPPAPAPSAAPAPPPAPPRGKAIPRAQARGATPARGAAGARAGSGPATPKAPADVVPADSAASAGPHSGAVRPARVRGHPAAMPSQSEPTVLFSTNTTAAAAVRPVRGAAARYTQHLPPATGKAFLASAKVPLIRGESLYADVAGQA